jgi:hypothetical protein
MMMIDTQNQPRPCLADLRGALKRLAFGNHTPASLQESYGRGLVRYLAEREWAEELPSADELGLTDDGWRQYVELVIDPYGRTPRMRAVWG